MSHLGQIKRGMIVFAPVCEPDGTPVGPHPCLVLSKQSEIDAGLDLQVVVGTTSFSRPLQSGWFDIPSGAGSNTSLRHPTVIKATWTQVIPQRSVISVCERVPKSIVQQATNWLRDKLRDAELKGNEPGKP